MHAEQLINLTPHAIFVFQPGSEVDILLEIPKTEPPAVLEFVDEPEELTVGDVEIASGRLRYTGVITGLPEPKPGVLYVCSRLTAAVAGRPDVVFPDDEVRKDGTVVGCHKLSFAAQWPKEW